MKKILLILLLLVSQAYADEFVTIGATSQCFDVFISDSSSTTGAGLTTPLVFNTASLSCYYHESNKATATAITLVTMTLGTFTSSGFVVVDNTNMPGWYQLCLPNAALDEGRATSVQCKGAANMAPMNLRVVLLADSGVTKSKAELAADPGSAAATIEDQIRWLYQFFHNKVTQTATQRKVYKDDGSTVLTTQTTGDTAGTFTVGEGS